MIRDTSHPGIAPNSLDEHIPSTAFVLKQVDMAELKLSSVMSVGCIQLEGGPATDALPSTRTNFARHAVAPLNIQ